MSSRRKPAVSRRVDSEERGPSASERGPNATLGVNGKAVVVDSRDNVATALSDLRPGDMVELHTGETGLVIEIISPIPFGHKFSLGAITAGSPITKYGETIGIATADIRPGEHVHTHNVVSARGRGDLAGGKP